MALSHWAHEDDREAYEAAYQEASGLWPQAHESSFVDTPFGPTHVLSAGTPGGEPVVALHAASLSAIQWHPQAASLGDACRIHAVDIMADIGLSTQTRALDTHADAASWLASVLDGLELERAVLMGSSFGGFHAANLALHHPERVKALVLLAPAATVQPFKWYMRLGIRMGSLVPMRFSVKPGLRALMLGELPDARIVRLMELGVAGFRYDRHSIFPSSFEDAELASIEQPTLLLIGDRERIYAADAAVARAARLMPHVDARVMPGVGHLMALQCPDLVDPILREAIEAAA